MIRSVIRSGFRRRRSFVYFAYNSRLKILPFAVWVLNPKSLQRTLNENQNLAHEQTQVYNNISIQEYKLTYYLSHVVRLRLRRSTRISCSPSLRARTHYAIFVYFAKKIVIISVIQVRPVIFFFPPNFVKHYQTSQAPSSCFGAGQIFGQV